MRCPDHCPSPDHGVPWWLVPLAILAAALVTFMTWFANLVGRLGLFLIGAIPMVVVSGMVTLFVLNAIENARRAKEAKLPWRSTPRSAAPNTATPAVPPSPAVTPARALDSVPLGSAGPRLVLLPGGLDDDGTGGERVA